LQAGHLQRDVTAYLPYAIKATRDGIPRAHLVSHHEDGSLLAELFTNGGTGTMIARDSLVKVHRQWTTSAHPEPDPPAGRTGHSGQAQPRSIWKWIFPNTRCWNMTGKIYGCVAMHVFPGSRHG
jgi:amino-acid N-acetyltransferase